MLTSRFKTSAHMLHHYGYDFEALSSINKCKASLKRRREYINYRDNYEKRCEYEALKIMRKYKKDLDKKHVPRHLVPDNGSCSKTADLA